MNVKPILFNTEMVKAIQEGRKSQTRRLVKPQPETLPDHLLEAGMNIIRKGKLCKLHEPYSYAARTRGELIAKPVKPPCQPGDILWVRETCCRDAGRYMYRANYADNEKFYRNGQEVNICWKPSIHMPKEAARIFLRVKNVRVELLRNAFFTDGAAIMEVQKEGVDIGETCRACIEHYGCPCCIDADGDTECVELDNPRYVFSKLWDSTIKPADLPRHGWIANPWVWVITFERIEKPEGWCR